MSAWALVLAAGRGERAGFGENKVFQRAGRCSVLTRCLRALEQSGCFDGAVLVLAEDDFDAYAALCAREGRAEMVKAVAVGGSTRQQSVENGLRALPPEVEIVAIHDAARPFVSPETVRLCVEAARRTGSGVACAPVVDTIKQLRPDGGVDTPDRNTLRAAQTPQAFGRDKIERAYARAREEHWTATDDADLYARCWGTVTLCESPDAARNVKLTTREDFARVNAAATLRVGTGFDAHRLVEGRRLVLCGVEVPFSHGLEGHSDADVAAHALMDALLGAAGAGDIGRHFPDSDPSLAGVDSMLLLARVMDMLAQRNLSVVNADLTIIAQRPRLAPYIEEMRQRLAAELTVDAECVNVKATTTEYMGFAGRGEGICAQATALLAKGGV